MSYGAWPNFKPPQTIKPMDHKLMGDGPISQLTTHKHDYTAKPLQEVERVIHPGNLGFSDEPMDGKWAVKLPCELVLLIALGYVFQTVFWWIGRNMYFYLWMVIFLVRVEFSSHFFFVYLFVFDFVHLKVGNFECIETNSSLDWLWCVQLQNIDILHNHEWPLAGNYQFMSCFWG